VANTIRIKRRASGGTGAPATLANAELAFNEVDKTLWYGVGTGGVGGSATTVECIGGAGGFLALAGAQSVTGDKTFSGVVTLSGTGTSSAVGVTQLTSDNSTRLATTAYVKSLGYGTGSVTSVSLSLPSFITVTGSPVTTNGTLTGTLASQTANTIFAAPDGTAGSPTFRALTSTDIPSLDASKIATGTLPIGRGGTGSTTGSITGSGALTFASGGTNTSVTLTPNGTGTVDVSSFRITNCADPTGAQDVATRNYVDSVAQGLDVKASVKAATTANITLSGAQTIDGIALVAGDRCLVKNQSTTSANGLYLVSAGAWTRTTDADAWTELPGAFTFVEQGTTQADTGWVCTVDAGGTLNTTAISFSQFSGAGSYIGGAGLTLTGSTFDVASTGGGSLTVTADSINLTSGIATAGTYRSLTVDTYGRVTAGTNPTTFSGYGISDSSANFFSALTDKSGTGGTVVFSTAPSLTTPSLSGETFSTTNNVTAGTNTQGQGALTSDYNVITTAAANPSGVTLPTATIGRRIVVVNKGANPINIFPATGGTIDALAANASIQLAVNGVMEFNASSTTQWYSSFNASVAGTGVASFSTGTTGLSVNQSTGAVTLAGTLGPANGGTGVSNNASYTITLGGAVSTASSFTIAGANALTLTTTGATSLTLPTSGTVLSDASTLDCGTF
jgi:hypothetical protein